MDYERAYDLMDIEQRCVLRASDKRCDRDCEKCDLVQDSKELVAAYEYAKMALGSLRQVQWERDVALEQLKEFDVQLGQKYYCQVVLTGDPVTDRREILNKISEYWRTIQKVANLYMNKKTKHHLILHDGMIIVYNTSRIQYGGYDVIIDNSLSDNIIQIME